MMTYITDHAKTNNPFSFIISLLGFLFCTGIGITLALHWRPKKERHKFSIMDLSTPNGPFSFIVSLFSHNTVRFTDIFEAFY